MSNVPQLNFCPCCGTNLKVIAMALVYQGKGVPAPAPVAALPSTGTPKPKGKQPARIPVTPEEKQKIVAALETQKSPTLVAKEFGRNVSTIYALKREIKKEGVTNG